VTFPEALSPETLAAIDAAADRNVARAPAPKAWQVAVLAPLFAQTLRPAPARRAA
jgi:hypothetical protein